MVSKKYKNATGYGTLLTFFIGVFYLGLNIFLNPAFLSVPLNNWIFIGPLIFISQSGFFLYLHFTSREGFIDEEDKKRIHERYRVLISSLLGFVIWLLVLGTITIIHRDINAFLSIFFGFAVIYGTYHLLKYLKRISGTQAGVSE